MSTKHFCDKCGAQLHGAQSVTISFRGYFITPEKHEIDLCDLCRLDLLKAINASLGNYRQEVEIIVRGKLRKCFRMPLQLSTWKLEPPPIPLTEIHELKKSEDTEVKF